MYIVSGIGMRPKSYPMLEYYFDERIHHKAYLLGLILIPAIPLVGSLIYDIIKKVAAIIKQWRKGKCKHMQNTNRYKIHTHGCPGTIVDYI